MNPASYRCIALMGATATGKSNLGVRLAGRFGGEIISMDSRQVYRGMDIGTGKLTPDEQGGIPHHLYDLLEPSEAGNAGRHARLAREAAIEITRRGNAPFLVGGTGLYFDAVFNPLIDVDIPREELDTIRAGFERRTTDDLYEELTRVDPNRAQALSPNDRVRIGRALEIFAATGKPMSDYLSDRSSGDVGGGDWRFLKFVLTMPRDRLRRRIADRTRGMYAAGWVEEVVALLARGYGPDSPGMRSLGYEEIAHALRSGDDPIQTREAVITRTQQYAKRQETYFRKDPESTWLDVTDDDYVEQAAAAVVDFLGREAGGGRTTTEP